LRVFSYRNKKRAKAVLLVLAAAIAILLLFILCRFIYLQRFLVYSDLEVKLDYEQDLQPENQESPTVHPEHFPLEIVPPEAVQQVGAAADSPMKPLSGYYITTNMLLNLPAVEAALDALETPPETLLFEMKSIYGNFYYPSDLRGAVTANADTDGISDLIVRYQDTGTTYLAARIPSFTDNNFALDNQPSGLPLRSGALWMDENNCYWLDPLAEDVQDYLISIATELAEMGFDEIVFDGFRIPDSENIVYDSGELTREGAAAEAARILREALEPLSIRISFGSDSAMVAKYTDRVYLTTDNGAAAAEMVAAVSGDLDDPHAQIVFQTASRDTRFDGYGILRPLIEGISEE